ncbi:transglutaminase-like cysteine peptidase [Aestuariivirga sp.]|uniref:transglutaminase-like cysteine peptidase n=1 Tax=Aestuariivirga sp. TaxID=2650926 RepID=UPI0025BEC154|nr:transglutaminase-like cysteine peptidase [Aestuariivirga sp.]MCA3554768.1 transglutaminase-like cysteine peptidase [Aestuariivirga sp.]
MGKIAWGTALLLGCLLTFISPSLASSNQKLSAFAREYSETLPPIGFVEFCQRSPENCQPDGSRSRRVAMTGEKWLLVRMVNAFVNGAIAPVTDETLYGTAEYWTIPTDAGDCEDVVLLKKKILMSKGIPEEALRITVVLDEHGEGHAVLTLTAAAGDYILDNRRNDIRPWGDTGYAMLKRQSAQDPRKWVSLEPARPPGAAIAGTASK